MARAIRNAIRANRFATNRFAIIETPILKFIARQADLHESLEFPIRANHATKVLKFQNRKGRILKNQHVFYEDLRFGHERSVKKEGRGTRNGYEASKGSKGISGP